MVSSFEKRFPRSVLQTIAFFCFTASIFGPPKVLQLLLLNHTFYHALRLQDCPELYAQIFRVYFDLAPHARRRLRLSSDLSDKCLAAELVRRFGVLRRVRLLQFSEQCLRLDLWTAYLMVLESDGHNEAMLAAAGISRFIFEFIRRRFREEYIKYGQLSVNEVNSLALWLACLTASSKTIASESPEGRNELYDLLRPLAVAFASGPPITHTPPKACVVIYYSMELLMTCPKISSASIFLVFLLKDTAALDLPTHLPQTRAISDALQRDGLTIEDYVVVVQSKTPTIAGSELRFPSPVEENGTDLPRSMMHNDDFGRVVLDFSAALFTPLRAYTPCVLTGLWEGQYMDSPRSSDSGSPLHSSLDHQDFLSRFPMQINLREQFGPCPDGALPNSEYATFLTVRTQRRDASDSESELPQSTSSQTSSPMSPSSSLPSTILGNKDVPLDLDAVVTGETLSDYEKTCGAFNYIGGVRFRDGLIVLRREPKHREEKDRHGIWVFEGYLHAKCALVGRWHSTPTSANEARLEGIFCMSKRPEVLVRDTSWSRL